MAPLTYTGPPSRKTGDFYREVERTQLWTLDFDQVRPITMDKNGVEQAVEAAVTNDPYIPKPGQMTSDEREVWTAFAVAYLGAANQIFAGERGDILLLPTLFIKGLIEAQKKKDDASAKGNASGVSVLPKSGSRTSEPPTSGPPTSGPPTSGPPTSGPPTSGPPASGPPTSGPLAANRSSRKSRKRKSGEKEP